jgi:hypothetical protein
VLDARLMVELHTESHATKPSTHAWAITRRADRGHRLAGQRASRAEHRHTEREDRWGRTNRPSNLTNKRWLLMPADLTPPQARSTPTDSAYLHGPAAPRSATNHAEPGNMAVCPSSTMTSARPCAGCGPPSAPSTSSRSSATTRQRPRASRSKRQGWQTPNRMTPEEHGEAHALLVKGVSDRQAARQALDELLRKLLVVDRLLEAEERLAKGEHRPSRRNGRGAQASKLGDRSTRGGGVSLGPPGGSRPLSYAGGRVRDLASGCNKAAVNARKDRGSQGSDREALGPPAYQSGRR